MDAAADTPGEMPAPDPPRLVQLRNVQHLAAQAAFPARLGRAEDGVFGGRGPGKVGR